MCLTGRRSSKIVLLLLVSSTTWWHLWHSEVIRTNEKLVSRRLSLILSALLLLKLISSRKRLGCQHIEIRVKVDWSDGFKPHEHLVLYRVHIMLVEALVCHQLTKSNLFLLYSALEFIYMLLDIAVVRVRLQRLREGSHNLLLLHTLTINHGDVLDRQRQLHV